MYEVRVKKGSAGRRNTGEKERDGTQREEERVEEDG